MLVAGALGGLTWHYLNREIEPEPNFKCTFVAQPDAAPVRFGNINGPISKIGIGGYLDDPFEGEVYDFEGRAKLEASGMLRSYLARGSVFVWEEGKVGDLSITLEVDPNAQRTLTLITFDRDGSLSEAPIVAYAFDMPELKLAHPMKYRCTFIGPLPKESD